MLENKNAPLNDNDIWHQPLEQQNLFESEVTWNKRLIHSKLMRSLVGVRVNIL